MTPATSPAGIGEATERNIRVQNRYDELMTWGKHGHYETMFCVVREEVERAARLTAPQPAEGGDAPNVDAIALSIAAEIVSDICNRAGLRQAWEKIDHDIQKSIKAGWQIIAADAITEAIRQSQSAKAGEWKEKHREQLNLNSEIGQRIAEISAALNIATNWNHADTAPKDGSHIIVINERDAAPVPATIHWFHDGAYSAWQLSVNHKAEDSEFTWPFSHWLPAPDFRARTPSQDGSP